MRIGGRRPELPVPHHVAAALEAAASTLGHRPAITLLRPDRREEQGFASLRQWASKGSHYLTLEQLLEPGDTVAVLGPAGWLPAAVCLAAWWAGLTVTTSGPGAVVVAHEQEDVGDASEVAWFGDALDGAPVGGIDGDAYVVAVQSFPDQPPLPRASGDAVALRAPAEEVTQAELIARAHDLAPDGPVGIEAGADPEVWIPAVAVRPLVTGYPTVVLAGADRSAAAAERVTTWLT